MSKQECLLPSCYMTIQFYEYQWVNNLYLELFINLSMFREVPLSPEVFYCVLCNVPNFILDRVLVCVINIILFGGGVSFSPD